MPTARVTESVLEPSQQGETPLEDNVLVELLEDGEGSAGSRPQGTRRAACRNRVSWHLPLGTITAEVQPSDQCPIQRVT